MAARSSTGMLPSAWTTQARHRRASSTPGATRAPVGQAVRQRVQGPHPAAWSAGATASPGVAVNGASVTTEPSTNHEPCPSTIRRVFFPNHPSPARCAAALSTSPFWSQTTVARHPS